MPVYKFPSATTGGGAGTAVLNPDVEYTSNFDQAVWEQTSGDDVGATFVQLHTPSVDYVCSLPPATYTITFAGIVVNSDVDANARLSVADAGGVTDTVEGPSNDAAVLIITNPVAVDLILHWDHPSPESYFVVDPASTITIERT